MKKLIAIAVVLLALLPAASADAQVSLVNAYGWEKPSTRTPTDGVSATVEHPVVKWGQCAQNDHVNSHVTVLGSGAGRLDAGIMTWCNWQDVSPFYFVWLDDQMLPGRYVNTSWPLATDSDGDGIVEGHIEIVKDGATWKVFAEGKLLAEVPTLGVAGRSGTVVASQSKFGQSPLSEGGATVFTDLMNSGEPWDRGGAQSRDGCARFSPGPTLSVSVLPGFCS